MSSIGMSGMLPYYNYGNYGSALYNPSFSFASLLEQYMTAQKNSTVDSLNTCQCDCHKTSQNQSANSSQQTARTQSGYRTSMDAYRYNLARMQAHAKTLRNLS